jgi:hypothetical protein
MLIIDEDEDKDDDDDLIPAIKLPTDEDEKKEVNPEGEKNPKNEEVGTKEEEEENLMEMKTASTTPMDGAPYWEEEEEEEKQMKETIITIPLLDYLCAYMECSLKELQVLLQTLEPRRRILAHLQTCHLRTSHLRPPERNLPLHAHDLSSQNANFAYACGGYLDITVRQYYYVRHNRKLKHPYLPCLIEFGGGQHVSYYPLEVIAVHLTKTSTAAGPSTSSNPNKKILTTPIINHNMCGCHHHHCCCAI